MAENESYRCGCGLSYRTVWASVARELSGRGGCGFFVPLFAGEINTLLCRAHGTTAVLIGDGSGAAIGRLRRSSTNFCGISVFAYW
jgi:hypothetical protein